MNMMMKLATTAKNILLFLMTHHVNIVILLLNIGLVIMLYVNIIMTNMSKLLGKVIN